MPSEVSGYKSSSTKTKPSFELAVEFPKQSDKVVIDVTEFKKDKEKYFSTLPMKKGEVIDRLNTTANRLEGKINFSKQLPASPTIAVVKPKQTAASSTQGSTSPMQPTASTLVKPKASILTSFISNNSSILTGKSPLKHKVKQLAPVKKPQGESQLKPSQKSKPAIVGSQVPKRVKLKPNPLS